MNDELLTIQEAAAHTGLSVHTLRYYERAGLLSPVGRAANGYRRYDSATLGAVRFLCRLRDTGMGIRQMRRYADLLRQGEATLAERRAMLEQHRQSVEAHIALLEENLDLISRKIDLYQQREAEASERTVG